MSVHVSEVHAPFFNEINTVLLRIIFPSLKSDVNVYM
jgi:hypothetical protein